MKNNYFKLILSVSFLISALLIAFLIKARIYFELEKKAQYICCSVDKFGANAYWHTVKETAYYDFNRLSKRLKLMFADPQELDSVHVYIDKNKYSSLLNELYENDIFNNKPRANAYVRFVNKNSKLEEELGPIPAKFKFRGDGFYHWHPPKKSFRVELEKGYSFNGNRKINIVSPPNPEYLATDTLLYEISRELNILTPDSDLVHGYINGEYRGIFVRLSQPDESLLRKNNRMPGSIYKGDFILNPKLGKNGESLLFYNWEMWKKVAYRNAESKQNLSDIQYFTKSIRDYSDNEFYHFVNSKINKKAYFSYMALDVLFGSGHHDFTHNHFLYYDPYMGKYEPIQWDIRYVTSLKEKDVSVYPLLNRVKLNPILEHERDVVSYNIFKKYDITTLLSRIDENRQRFYRTSGYDSGIIKTPSTLSGGILTFANVKDFDTRLDKLFINPLKKRNAILQKTFEDIFVSVVESELPKGITKYTFYIKGNTSAKIFIENKVLTYLDVDNSGHIGVNDIKLKSNELLLYPGRKKVVRKKPPHPYLAKDAGYYLAPSTMSYTLLVKGTLKYNITNALTGDKVISSKFDTSDELDTISIYPWSIKEYMSDTKNISIHGSVKYSSDQHFSKNTIVTIEPGAKIYLDPNVSLVFKGKVQFLGTKTSPIIINRADKDRPWGSIIIQGENSNSSIVKNTYIYGGGSVEINDVSYTGQLNVYNSKNFLIDGLLIEKNSIGDDNLHIAYSNGIIKNSIFRGSLYDAVDIDISEVTLENNLFIGTGNDAIDLMNSRVKAEKIWIFSADDKCFSVGERSSLELKNSFLSGCEIGLQIKDESNVSASGLFLKQIGSNHIHLNRKNLLYSKGGSIDMNRIITTDKVPSLYRSTTSQVKGNLGRLGNQEISKFFESTFEENNCVHTIKDTFSLKKECDSSGNLVFLEGH